MIVAEKSPKRQAQSSPTKYQNLLLIDVNGNHVQAVIFGRDIDLRDDTLQIYQSYYIGNALVKLMDPRHKREAYEFQWIINSRTIVEDIQDDDAPLRAPDYNIIHFPELNLYKDTDEEIDILAIVIHMNMAREVNTTHGKSLVQDIYVLDSSQKVLRLSMWNRFVNDECRQIYNILMNKPILLGTRIRVSSYNGLSLSSRPTSVFTIEPFLACAASLRAWATENNKVVEEIIANNFNRPSVSTSAISADPLIKISEIAESLKAMPSMTRSTFSVRGKFMISDLHQPFYYLSCGNCGKTTGYEKDEQFLCYNCKELTTAQPRCRVYLNAFDDSDSTAVVAFGSIVEQIFDCTTTELVQHADEKDLACMEILANTMQQKEWMIVLAASMNEFGKLRQNKLNVVSVNEVTKTTE